MSEVYDSIIIHTIIFKRRKKNRKKEKRKLVRQAVCRGVKFSDKNFFAIKKLTLAEKFFIRTQRA